MKQITVSEIFIDPTDKSGTSVIEVSIESDFSFKEKQDSK
eukprot:CAMPEP_0116955994 /NCGR_PEP_ID=MMETSP0467-20121206/43027_1 /TAXON_ID=283647 /ORGANISM="Mesodinium pulex, Strain SPMC105" /LENGTH=39 /DNA_ID= /DNA_START= /DNA_END= /DNA_ORIENTATION=